MFVAAAGILPVSSIALHCLGILSLSFRLPGLILPGVILATVLTTRYPALGKTIFAGWLSGVVAVGLYDISRIPYILYGWVDFIPRIGAWLNDNTHPNALIGYLWRYAGNGGGMGITFFVLMKHFRPNGKMIQNGILYGLFIFSSLMFVLIFSEQGQDFMFHINPLSFIGSLSGHMVNGLALGMLAKNYLKNYQPETFI